MFKDKLTSGAGAASIALGGLLISVATGFLAHFTGWQIAIYAAGCAALVAQIYFRELFIKQAAEVKEHERRNELDSNFAELKQETEDAKQSYLKSQKDLADIIRLMPPAHTMRQFGLTYSSLHNQARLFAVGALKKPDALDPEKISSLIRQGLDALCWLMQRYQPSANDSPVSANLMRFHRITAVQKTPALKAFVEDHLRFVPVPSDKLQNLAGVLTLEQAHSASTRTPKPDDVDDRISPLALPIADVSLYAHDPANAIEYFIPVAPRGFAAGYQYHPDINVLTQSDYYQNSYFSPVVRDELIAYFVEKTTEQQIQSIVSIGLGKRFIDQGAGIPWGVINIQSPETNTMTEDSMASYIDIARPVFEVIKDLLLLHSELNQEA